MGSSLVDEEARRDALVSRLSAGSCLEGVFIMPEKEWVTRLEIL